MGTATGGCKGGTGTTAESIVAGGGGGIGYADCASGFSSVANVAGKVDEAGGGESGG